MGPTIFCRILSVPQIIGLDIWIMLWLSLSGILECCKVDQKLTVNLLDPNIVMLSLVGWTPDIHCMGLWGCIGDRGEGEERLCVLDPWNGVVAHVPHCAWNPVFLRHAVFFTMVFVATLPFGNLAHGALLGLRSTFCSGQIPIAR